MTDINNAQKERVYEVLSKLEKRYPGFYFDAWAVNNIMNGNSGIGSRPHYSQVQHCLEQLAIDGKVMRVIARIGNETAEEAVQHRVFRATD